MGIDGFVLMRISSRDLHVLCRYHPLVCTSYMLLSSTLLSSKLCNVRLALEDFAGQASVRRASSGKIPLQTASQIHTSCVMEGVQHGNQQGSHQLAKATIE